MTSRVNNSGVDAAAASSIRSSVGGTTNDNGVVVGTTTPNTRLMIDKMVLENFKSYAGIKTIGPFHKCFSSVVGPNGSGKSNVIDAMLFVFGKRAKKLRLNKVSELIHSSDAYKNKPLQYARVSVHFHDIIEDSSTSSTTNNDNDDKENNNNYVSVVNDYTVVPNSEIIVTRTARRDNTSSYQLNGKNVPFKRVAEFLGQKGIDLNNNRFLILQGEVEMISMMPPRSKSEDGSGDDDGLLEYLEDIIGSNQFVEATNEAYEKVEQLGEVRQASLNRVKAVEKEKDALEGAKLEAEALLLKERDLRRKQNILYQLHQSDVMDKLASTRDSRDVLKDELKTVRSQLTEHESSLKELKQDVTQKSTQYDASMTSLKAAKEEFTKYERLDIELREQTKHSKSQVTKIEKKLKSEQKKMDDYQTKVKEAEEQIPTLEAMKEKLLQDKEEADATLEDLETKARSQTETLRQQLELKLQELAPLKEERSEKQASLDTAQTEMKLLEDSTDRAKKQLDQAKHTLGTLDEKQSKLRNELASSEDTLEESKSRLEEATKEEQECTTKETTLSKQYQELITQVEYGKTQLEEAREMSSSSKGGGTCRNRAVNAILKEAKRQGSELSQAGIVGRLGDLCMIAEDYDVAISTACGMLDHVVTQTTKGTQACLEFLRANHLGRANFIPLDKMKKGAHDRPVETPEDSRRLFDLIQVKNPVLLPALYLAIGNTLVANDLETATRWAYDCGPKRWRVVTLDGKVIDTAGTMSGGGNTVSRGGMRLMKSNKQRGAASGGPAPPQVVGEELDVGKLERELAKLEQQTSKVLQELNDCRAKKKTLMEEIKTLKRTMKTLETKLPKLTLELEGCDTTRSELTQRLPALEEQSTLSEEDTQKLKELKGNVEECKLRLSECTMKSSKLESEVAKLQKQVLNAGGSELKQAQDRVAKLSDDIDRCAKDIRQANVVVSSSEKNRSKSETIKADLERELEETKQSLEDLSTKMKSLEEKALIVMKAYEDEKRNESNMRNALEDATKALEDFSKSKSSLVERELELSSQVDNLTKSYKELSKQDKHWTKMLTELQKRDDEANAEYDLDDDDDDDDEDKPTEKEKDSANSKDGNKEGTSNEEEHTVDDNENKEEDDNDDGDATGNRRSTRNKTQNDDNDDEHENAAESNKKKDNDVVMSSSSSLPKLSKAALEQYSVEDVERVIHVLQKERDTLAKTSNMTAIAEYRRKETDYLQRVAELDQITLERNDARRIHEDLRRKRLEMFMDGFGQITLKLKEMYQMITLGGDAELELVDSLDPFSEGIVFSVRPPKKSWKNISNLSGGEKTLSSLALVFALHHYRPTPLYVMDEIDAALDFKNVSIVANYIKTRTKNAQFIIISLRNNMFELADRLVGIYKTHNCTKSITIDPAAFATSSNTTAKTTLTAEAAASNATETTMTAVASA